MGYESYLRKQRISVSSRRYYRFFTGLSLRLRADMPKVTAHERIQLDCFCFLSDHFDFKASLLNVTFDEFRLAIRCGAVMS
jgi:hypothetical protein